MKKRFISIAVIVAIIMSVAVIGVSADTYSEISDQFDYTYYGNTAGTLKAGYQNGLVMLWNARAYTEVWMALNYSLSSVYAYAKIENRNKGEIEEVTSRTPDRSDYCGAYTAGISSNKATHLSYNAKGYVNGSLAVSGSYSR